MNAASDTAFDTAADVAPTRGHKKKQRTRTQLVRAAIDVIAHKGEAFSISDVTSAAGMSNGTFYNYFDDREQLVAAVVPEVLSTFADFGAAVVDETDAAARFATISALVLRRAAITPEQVRVLLRVDAVQQAIVDGVVVRHLRADLETGREAGVFAVDVDDATIDVIVGSLLVASRRLSDGAASRRYAERVVAQLLRSVGVADAIVDDVAVRAVATAESLIPGI